MALELKYLTWVTVLTALLWVPYILNEIMVRGLADALGYPANPKPLAPWAQRMKAAHYNAVENLVVFATLIFIGVVAGVHRPAIVSSAYVYFWARAVHVAAYTFAIPGLRTLAFLVGVGCQLCIAWHLLF
ncbi:MAG: MAPEG family protein [Steroidobacteraceae bacterium]|jgi:uncharacterized MAPEG superfamily protein